MQLIEKVTVVGAGHAGRQIAHCLQAAGFQVCCYEKNEPSLAAARKAVQKSPLPALSAPGFTGQTYPLFWTCDLSVADQADLVIETVTENLSVKRDAILPFFDHCSPTTIFVTNSSYLMPSSIFSGIARPERTAALHFHLPIWFARAVDVMPSARTSSETLEALVNIVCRMGLTPIRLRREYPGYVFNTLLHPLLIKSLELAEREVCSPAEVDLSWREITHMTVGPFAMMQQIGLPTLRTIVERAATVTNDPSTQRALAYLAKWDGSLENTDPRSTLSSEPTTSNAHRDSVRHTKRLSYTGPDRNDQQRFRPYQVTWKPSSVEASRGDTGNSQQVAAPLQLERGHAASRRWLIIGNSGLATSLRSLLRAELTTTDQMIPDSAEASSTDWMVIIDPFRDEDSNHSLAVHLENQIRILRSWFTVRSQVLAIRPRLVVIAPLNESGRSSAKAWGLAGMLKAAWLETIQSTPSGLRADDIQLLEVDYRDPKISPAIASYISHRDESGPRDIDAKQLAGLHHRYLLGQYFQPYLSPLMGQPSVSSTVSPIDGTRWVITGGARGITYRLALELAKKGASLHLLGRTKSPATRWFEYSDEAIKEARQEVCRSAFRAGLSPAVASSRFDAEVELSRNLHELSQSGIEFEYHVADVTSADMLGDVVSHIRCTRGPIDGFLHGAGIEQTIRLEKKPDSLVQQTLKTKVAGAQSLSQIMDRATRWFIQSGSLSGFFGGIGQIDYAAANGFLAEMSESINHQRPDLQALTIAWPGWEGVGMAARPASRWALRQSGHELMSIQEGIDHFVALLRSGISGHVLLINPSEIPEVFLNPLSQTSGASGE